MFPFELAADHLREPVFLLSQNCKIAWANRAAGEVTGRTPQSLCGMSFMKLLTPESAEAAEVALQSRASLVELDFIRPDLSARRLEVSFSAIAAGSAQHQFVVVGRDVSERGLLEEERRRANFQTLQFQSALLELTRAESWDLEESLSRIIEVGAATLNVARAAVWIFNENHTEIACRLLFDREKNSQQKGASLEIARYPRHFAELEECRIIAAHDAITDTRTAELASDYLSARNISSMLEVPIRREGKTIGVLCHEHTGPPRHWKMDERNFAASMADLTALVLETDRRRSIEHELRRSSANLELFFSQSLDGFFFLMLDEPVVWDATVDKQRVLDYVFEHERITKANDALLRQYGASREQLAGLTPLDFFAHNPAHGKELWRRMLDSGRLHVESDERRLDGSRMWIEGDYICLFDADGRFTGHFGIQRDVTERKQAEEALRHYNRQIAVHAAELELRVAERTSELVEANASLRDSEERLAGVFGSAMDAIVVIDSQRNIVILNQAAEKMFRCAAQDVIGKAVDTFLSRELARVLQSYMTGDSPAARQLWVPEGLQAIRNDGERFAIEATLSRAGLSSGTLFTMILRDINQRKEAEEMLVYLREEIRSELNSDEIIGASAAMQKVFRSIGMVAATDSTVLLEGETGTGKEMIARALHNRSRRKQNVMIKVNCGALPVNLVESELFGHEKGAFTGAVAQKKGRFELAHRGTIFLDEVGELPLETQTKLLRILQEQEYERVGGSQTLKVDVRVIAATNRKLSEEVRRGAFRADLFYRLNVFPIHVPPLRERREDIPVLAAYFVRKFSQRMGKRIQGISREALEQMQHYDWPGNVRELANLMERAAILCQGGMLQQDHTSVAAHAPTGNASLPTLEDAERRLIQQALERTDGVLAGSNGAAQLLGMNRSTLWSRMRKLGIEVPKSRKAGIGKAQ